jgi:plasmid stabilization system
LDELGEIADYIAIDSKARADSFIQNLKVQIIKIPDMPYSYRKNKTIDRENIRDLICKGYTITFLTNDNAIKYYGFISKICHASPK